MNTKRSAVRFLVLILPLASSGVVMLGCDLGPADFERISENGFDAEDNAVDWNDYPWAMLHFAPDGADEGHLYVATGNGINQLISGALGLLGSDTGERPPEIRRYRPDLGFRHWERVFDYRDFEGGPDFTATGFRHMAEYRSPSDGKKRLYASTFGAEPTVWRTETGEPGSWEKFWTNTEDRGSIRWMAEHDGLLYFAVANDITAAATVLTEPGQILATDGDTVWSVMDDGFGNPDNGAIMSLISHNGWLWAGTANAETGFEIWKLEGPQGQGPTQVVTNGATDWWNDAATTPFVFQENLYWGSMVFLGIYLKGCVLIRINDDDSWDPIVGPQGLSGYDAGFDNRLNGYLWNMQEYKGWLYAGTADFTSVLQAAIDNIDDAASLLPSLLGKSSEDTAVLKREPGLIGVLTQGGGDLWKSPDGIHWTPVFKNGLGDTYNWGVRNMVPIDGQLYLGLANPWDGLEIWRGPVDQADTN